jgi:hypothetical protein
MPTPLQRKGWPAEVRLYCAVDDAGRNLLRTVMQQLHMSARAYRATLSKLLGF